MIRFPCPSCGVRLTAKPERAGRRTNCPRCKAEVEVPVPDVPLPDDYYERLQVSPSADPEVIAAAYRRLSLKYHPDRNPDGGRAMALLNEAFEALSNAKRRAAYDASRRSQSVETDSATSTKSAGEGSPPPTVPASPRTEQGGSCPFIPNVAPIGLITIYGVCGTLAVYGLLSWLGLRALMSLSGTGASILFVVINWKVVSESGRHHLEGAYWRCGAFGLLGGWLLGWVTGTEWLWGTGVGIGATASYAFDLGQSSRLSFASDVERARKQVLIAVASTAILVGSCLSFNSPGRFEERAMRAKARGDFAAAAEAYTRAIGLDGLEPRYFFGRAGVYIKMGDLDRARDDLTLAMQRLPRNWDCFYLRGCVQHDRTAYADAASDFSEAAAILRARLDELHHVDPPPSAEHAALQAKLVEVLRRRAKSYEVIGDRIRMEQDLKEANQLAPKAANGRSEK